MVTDKWSELDLIELFAGRAKTDACRGLVKGIGDDCAIFDNIGNRTWIVTTDILVEDVHFNRSWHPPRLLGKKSIAVNLSDIAAMGGTPHYALISIAVSGDIDKDWIDQWSAGVGEMLENFNCSLIGGDTVKGPALIFNIVVLGSVVKGGAVLRSTAQAGENVYVSGFLGSAAAGLEICRNPSTFDSCRAADLQPLIDKHLDPLPQVHLGNLLAKSDAVGAMQDLSDGLATDLAHICKQSGVGAVVEAGSLPSHPALDEVCRILKRQPARMKISGGEDYELLFTVKRGRDEELLNLLESQGFAPVFKVGKIREAAGVCLVGDDGPEDITFQGYQHSAGS